MKKNLVNPLLDRYIAIALVATLALCGLLYLNILLRAFDWICDGIRASSMQFNRMFF